jgi:hypothetical protein
MVVLLVSTSVFCSRENSASESDNCRNREEGIESSKKAEMKAAKASKSTKQPKQARSGSKKEIVLKLLRREQRATHIGKLLSIYIIAESVVLEQVPRIHDICSRRYSGNI